jgi:hypothetical protein
VASSSSAAAASAAASAAKRNGLKSADKRGDHEHVKGIIALLQVFLCYV